MYSYPNYIPLPAAGAKTIVHDSARRYLRAIGGLSLP